MDVIRHHDEFALIQPHAWPDFFSPELLMMDNLTKFG